MNKKTEKNLVIKKKSSNFASSKGGSPDRNDALWCNGSTPDSGSVCESSSLSKATKAADFQLLFLLIL